MHHRTITVCSLILFAIAVWVGCSSGPVQNQLPSNTVGIRPHRHDHVKRGDAPSAYIQHVFIIVQENRSLNNLFAGFPGAGTTMTGCMNSSGSGSGYGSSGCPKGDKSVPLKAVHLAGTQDIDHCYYDAVAAIDASGSTEPMDGYNHEYLGDTCATGGSGDAGKVPYAYVMQSDILPYWDIANNWVLAANFYPTELGPSFVAHLNLIAGTTEFKKNTAVANFPGQYPWGCDQKIKPYSKMQWLSPTHTPGPTALPTPCYNEFHTIADELDNPPTTNELPPSPIPWRYYAPAYSAQGYNGYIWSAFDAIDRVRNGPDWKKDVVSPSWQILKDIPNGTLDKVGVVWVVPNYKYSDHAAFTTDEGPSWVGDVVNAIGKRTALWSSSVIVILWDDWGGWYDNAPPPSPDFRGEGIRTPMLILSPYAKQGQDNGHVSLRYFNPGSILKFIEQVFSLQPLGSLQCSPSYGSGSGYGSACDRGYTDATANSIDYVLNFTQSPRPYGTMIPTKYGDKFFEHGCGTGKGSGCGYGSGPGSDYAFPPDSE
jgi:phospholipase C